MSTSPDLRTEDRIVGLLSRWLARHVDNDGLRSGLEQAGLEGLSAGQRNAVEELLGELDGAAPGERGDVEMLARETLEALALGL